MDVSIKENIALKSDTKLSVPINDEVCRGSQCIGTLEVSRHIDTDLNDSCPKLSSLSSHRENIMRVLLNNGSCGNKASNFHIKKSLGNKSDAMNFTNQSFILEEADPMQEKTTMTPSIQLTDEHSNTTEIFHNHIITVVDSPTILVEEEDEEEDDFPVLDLCECNPKYKNNSDIVPCYFCTYNQRRRASLGNLGEYSGSSLKPQMSNDRRATIHGDLNLENNPFSMIHPSLKKSSHDSLHSRSTQIRGSTDTLHSEAEDYGKNEQMSTIVSIFCAQRLQKLACSVPFAVGLSLLILGTSPDMFSFLNYTVVFVIVLFYPVFGVLGVLFNYIRRRFNIFPAKPKPTEDKATPIDDSPITVEIPPDVIPHRRNSRSSSICSRLSASFGTMPSISEELATEDSEQKGIETEDKMDSAKYEPCELCLRENKLGICTH